ncbi:UDP-N-acetylmuramoyl-L-alanine--D-glutamate ligase [Salinibius halmophilus]|uniref:UDP-N-acetylmuramoyl-L-alanine--D-glutamate ligase n=1 Tax=Salinibius halmophilus TaxID=1853216 RepID=UPI000E66CC76|nr:UDP-N-acetylmuramoyl-L-alanine--D-glutamate ligase [Salinibius halmophilus]
MTDSLNYLVVGLGKTGQSVLRHLARTEQAFVAWDTRANLPTLSDLKQTYPNHDFYAGDLPASVLASVDCIVVSPGVPLSHPVLQQAQAQGIAIIGDIDLWRQAINAPIVAITGSNAKSTVTSLVGAMAKAAGINVAVCGNLGTPVLDELAAQPDAQLWVVELSSFQLETTNNLNAAVATVLNLSEDHMDRYDSMAQYKAAKHRIFAGAEHVVVNLNDENSRPQDSGAKFISEFTISAEPSSAWRLSMLDDQEWLYQGRRPLMPVADVAMSGKQNYENALASAALATAVGVSVDAIKSALRSFSGLAHRCQNVAQINGVSWVNDSKGTNVGATLAAINGLHRGANLILLVGGVGKGADFSPLAPAMAQACKLVIGFGRDGASIANLAPRRYVCETLQDAVAYAYGQAVSGDVVLLSPACASFDQFDSFEHRGDTFVRLVKEL